MPQAINIKYSNRFSHLVNGRRIHESRQVRQFVMLDPFNLLKVGNLSLSRVFYSKWYRNKYRKNWEHYFDGFPENWSDLLGGV